MAKASWLTASPQSGNGNGSIQNSATSHTGRAVRTTTVTVTAVGVEKPVTYKVTQKAKAEFVNFSNGTEMSAPKTGGALTVAGASNSQSLTYAFVGDTKGVELPATYTANGLSTNNGEAISGDPGALSQYDSSIELTLPENKTIEEVERTIKVTAAGGQSAQITIRQAAGDAFINVDPTEITLEADGTAVSVTVKSNTQWTVE